MVLAEPVGQRWQLQSMDRQTRYYYDPSTHSYKEVRRTWIDWMVLGGAVLGLAALPVGLFVLGVNGDSVSTPEERSLRTENRTLERQLNRARAPMTRLLDQLNTLARRDQTLYRRLLETPLIPENVRQVAVAGRAPTDRFHQMNEPASALLRETGKMLDKLERRVRFRTASYRELTRAAARRGRRLKQFPAIRPSDGPIVSGYGMRNHPVLGVPKKHTGVDFLVPRGTPVVATGNATVEHAAYSSSYGNFVDIRHSASGHRTLYAHLSDIRDGIRPGAEVARGDTIGYSGGTGRTSGPHLHYEVLTSEGAAVDPMQFFIPDMTPEVYRALERRSRGDDTRVAGTSSENARASER